MYTLDPCRFTVGVNVFGRLSYYSQGTLIGFRILASQSSFATFVVAPTRPGCTIVDSIVSAIQNRSKSEMFQYKEK